MSYLYKVDQSFIKSIKTIFFDKQRIFISVKKITPYLRGGETIGLYLKTKYHEGLVGQGTIVDGKTYKTSELDLHENDMVINRNFYQVEIRTHTMAFMGVKIPIHILRQFPAYNSKSFQKPYNFYTLYWASSLSWEISHIETKFDYFFHRFNCNELDDINWQRNLHILREKDVPYRWHLYLPKKTRCCEKCGFQSYTPYLLEIHDTTVIDYSKTYSPIREEDFIILCPTCHKQEHLDMVYPFTNRINSYSNHRK